MRFEVDQSDKKLVDKIDEVVRGVRPMEALSCGYYDPVAGEVATTGCEVVGVTAAAIECGCTHMTDFMSFLNTGADVLTGSNYGVIFAVTQLTLHNLLGNAGAYLAVGYWAFFFLLLVLFNGVDRKQMHCDFYGKLY